MPEHEDGAVRVGDAVLADRAEEHAGELAMAAAADDEEVRAYGCLDEDLDRVTLGDRGVDLDAGVPGVQLGDGVVEHLGRFGGRIEAFGMGMG